MLNKSLSLALIIAMASGIKLNMHAQQGLHAQVNANQGVNAQVNSES